MTNSNEQTAIHKIFKAYDMRGTVDILTPEIYYQFGRGLVQEVLKPDNLPTKVAIMHDIRETSDSFYTALINGIESAGGEAIMLGAGSTDMLYGACQLFEAPGAMVTASHNPPEYNGCKVVKESPIMLGIDNGLDKIRDYVIDNIHKEVEINPIQNDEKAREELEKFFIGKMLSTGNVSEADEMLAKDGRKLRIVVDTANAVGGIVMDLIKDVYDNVEFIPLYWELDGTFPNHEADPDDLTNLEDLCAKVKSENADMGAMFDGDADRCYLVDETGEPLSNHYLMAKIGSEMVADVRSGKIEQDLEPIVVMPIADSRLIAEQIFLNGGAAMPTKYGHTFIKENMKKYNAVYGGEASGHHYFGNFGMMDSGALAFLYSIYLLAKYYIKPTELKQPYEKIYKFSGWHKYEVGDQSVSLIVDKIKINFSDAHFSHIEGVQLSYPEWKAMIRSSNTEPVIKISVETRDGSDPMGKLAEIKEATGIK